MPSKLRILAGYLKFCPHKNLIFSVRRRFSRSDGDSSVAAVCPFWWHSASPKGRSQDTHSAARHRVSFTLCTRREDCPFGARSTFGTAIVQKPCSPLRAIPPLGLRTKHKGVSALLGRFFQSLRIGGDGSPVPSVATDCDVDLRVALPSIYPCRRGRAPPVLNLLAAGQNLTTAKAFMHR